MRQIYYVSRSRFIVNFSVLLITLMISVSRGVQASYALTSDRAATPYPTLTPIATVPTSVPLSSSLDLSCPMGVPVGYGYVTPSTDWLYACGHCLPTYTPPAFYTSTPGATHTPASLPGTLTAIANACSTALATGVPCATSQPTATLTLTPTFTPTVAPTATSSFGAYLTCGSNCEQLNSYTVRYSRSFGSRFSVYTNFSTLQFYRSNVDAVLYHWAYYDVTFLNSPTDYNPKIIFYTRGSTTLDPAWSTFIANNEFSGAETYHLLYSGLVKSGAYSSSVGTLLTDYLDLDMYSGNTGSGFVVTGTVTHIVTLDPTYNPFVTATPTITPTSTLVSSVTPTLDPRYCGSISSSNIPNQFGFSGGNIVRQSCATFSAFSLRTAISAIFPIWIPSFLVNDFLDFLAALLPVDYFFDPLTVCIRERDYSLYLFGYRMPIEFIVGLAIFLSGLRFFVPTVFSGASMLGSGVGSSHDAEAPIGSSDVSNTVSRSFGKDAFIRTTYYPGHKNYKE